jgi:hypothetical protein
MSKSTLNGQHSVLPTRPQLSESKVRAGLGLEALGPARGRYFALRGKADVVLDASSAEAETSLAMR